MHDSRCDMFCVCVVNSSKLAQMTFDQNCDLLKSWVESDCVAYLESEPWVGKKYVAETLSLGNLWEERGCSWCKHWNILLEPTNHQVPYSPFSTQMWQMASDFEVTTVPHIPFWISDFYWNSENNKSLETEKNQTVKLNFHHLLLSLTPAPYDAIS